jgi:hypothetical protein
MRTPEMNKFLELYQDQSVIESAEHSAKLSRDFCISGVTVLGVSGIAALCIL